MRKVWLALFFLFLFYSYDYIGVAQSGLFFTENFETNLTGSFTSTNFGTFAGQSAVFSRSSSAPCSGSFSLNKIVTSGNDDPGFATQHFGDAGDDGGGPIYSGTSGTHYRDLYVQFQVKYPIGFVFNVNYKLFIILSEDNRTHDGPNPAFGDYLTLYVASGRHLRAELNDKSSTLGGQFVDIFPNLGQTDTITLNSCDTIEVRRKLNTVGSSDGIFQMWLNQVKITELTNVRWRVAVSGALGTNDTYGSNALMESDFATGADQSATIKYDNIKMSTSFIGTGVSSGGLFNMIRVKR